MARRLSGAELERVREQADRAAHARVARDVGELVLAESVEAVERNWTQCYLGHWVRSFAYFSALELTGHNHDAAREIVGSPEIQKEIGARVSSLLADVTGSQ
jgi:hypothetical protein